MKKIDAKDHHPCSFFLPSEALSLFLSFACASPRCARKREIRPTVPLSSLLLSHCGLFIDKPVPPFLWRRCRGSRGGPWRSFCLRKGITCLVCTSRLRSVPLRFKLIRLHSTIVYIIAVLNQKEQGVQWIRQSRPGMSRILPCETFLSDHTGTVPLELFEEEGLLQHRKSGREARLPFDSVCSPHRNLFAFHLPQPPADCYLLLPVGIPYSFFLIDAPVWTSVTLRRVRVGVRARSSLAVL